MSDDDNVGKRGQTKHKKIKGERKRVVIDNSSDDDDDLSPKKYIKCETDAETETRKHERSEKVSIDLC